ncbi:hypothetical protein LA76x_2881 [Lysobacter antibioticus]|uniref:Uncharacterized protein n=1 Tax=Lysobacter antibioticus TaxID=84531 RepID=A0A0S2FBY8_LYSAN|nr:hypothetical protein LA76x_2881 [Lysobacter antibioticus]
MQVPGIRGPRRRHRVLTLVSPSCGARSSGTLDAGSGAGRAFVACVPPRGAGDLNMLNNHAAVTGVRQARSCSLGA